MKMLLSLMVVGFTSFASAYDGSMHRETTADQLVEKLNSNMDTKSTAGYCTKGPKEEKVENLNQNVPLSNFLGNIELERLNPSDTTAIYKSASGLWFQMNSKTLVTGSSRTRGPITDLVSTWISYDSNENSINVNFTRNTKDSTTSTTTLVSDCLYTFKLK